MTDWKADYLELADERAELEARLAAAEEREKRIAAICDEFWPEGSPPYHQSTLDLVAEIREVLAGVDKPA